MVKGDVSIVVLYPVQCRSNFDNKNILIFSLDTVRYKHSSYIAINTKV